MDTPLLRLDQATYTYPTGAGPAVDGVDLAVAAGEVVLLTGPTGCGKSTLLRLAAGLLQRHGHGAFAGRVRVAGRDPAAAPPRERVGLVGFVAQEPGDQIVAGRVADEVAFGLESAGWSPGDIDRRVPEALAMVGLDLPPSRSTSALSGGQRQRLVIAAALAGGARLLLLDEPLAQLDPAGAAALLGQLRGLAAGGVAVLMVEHRLEAARPACDRLVLMADGRLAGEGWDRGRLRRLGLTLPGLMDLDDRLARVGLDRGALDALAARPARPAQAWAPPAGTEVLSAEDLRFTWPGGDAAALAGISLIVCAGERVALVGPNGAGKSTLLAALAGQIDAGEVRRAGRLVDVPQEPDLALFCETVRDELAYGPIEARLPPPAVTALVGEAAAALSVHGLLDRPPQALSRGQRLRVAVAAALACAPLILALDEPTSGQDHDQVERMMAALREGLAGGALLFATHDLGLALRHATRLIVVAGGRIAADGPPAAVLADPPPGVALPLPPLARLCLDRGVPPDTAAGLAARLVGRGA